MLPRAGGIVLEISNLKVGYQRGSLVLDGLSMAIGKGQSIALLGRNGMGKTTLVRTVAGHLKPAAGSIALSGNAIAGLAPFRIARAGIGYVPQGREIFSDFTVEENLRMGLLGKPGLGDTIPDWAYELFPILNERRDQRAGTMSGGQQQQLAIMRALLGKPDLLILDEPSEGIQPSIVHDIGETLKGYAKAHSITILLVEQNLDLVALLAEAVFFIENGAIAEYIDNVARLQDEPELIHRYLAV